MGNKIKSEIRDMVYNKYLGKCAYCGTYLQRDKFTIDHIDPLRRGDKGSKAHLNVISNYNPACTSCNSSKSTFSLDRWKQMITNKKKSLFRDNSAFRILLRFGLVKFTTNDVVFYFETKGKGANHG